MLDRYRAALALTSILLLATAPGHRHKVHSAHTNLASPPGGIEIYSRRALRRARTILQLKLLQLHELQLDRLRRAVENVLKAGPPHP